MSLQKSIIIIGILISNIAFAQPINDDLSNATVVTTLPFSDVIISDDAMDATVEINENTCVSDEAWWYAFTPSYTGYFAITAEVVGAEYSDDENEIQLGYYTGSAHPLTELDCFDNDRGIGLGEDEYVYLTSGTTYYFRVAAGDVSLILDVTFTVRVINDWTGAVSNDWSNSSNWALGSLPTTDEVALLIPGANEVAILSGTNAVANRVVLGGADLDINQGGSLTVSNSSNNGVWLESPNSILTVDGDLTITDVADIGLFCEAGVVDINATANLTFSNNYLGMYFLADETHTIDGTVSIMYGSGGIFLSGIDTVYIGSSSTIYIENMYYDGFILYNEDALLQIDGTVNIDTVTYGIYLDEGTVDINGTLNINVVINSGIELLTSVAELYIDSSGVLNISQVGEYGILDVNGSNAGTINIIETGDDAINTGSSTFTNTGTIVIHDAGADGIECDANFDNSGTVEIQQAMEYVINGATFNHLSGGTLITDGEVNATSVVFSSGSIISPGLNFDCMFFSDNEDLSGTTINIEIDNTTPCLGHDFIFAPNGLTLSSATLNLSGNYSPTVGDTVLIIELTNDTITGTFNGLNEGDFITLNGSQWSISYIGGDGNDVVLTNVALPVELLSFEGEQTEEGILLSWETATELNNDYFDIEFSLNGSNFEKIGQVQGAGTTLDNQSYEFIDDLNHLDLENQNSLYYRLKQVDFDGKYEYSNIIQLEIGNSQPAIVHIFPNPTTDFLNIEINANQVGKTIQLINSQGQVLQEFLAQNRSNQYQISHLPAGIYLIRIDEAIHKIVITK
jgi:hypothetical protein